MSEIYRRIQRSRFTGEVETLKIFTEDADHLKIRREMSDDRGREPAITEMLVSRDGLQDILHAICRTCRSRRFDAGLPTEGPFLRNALAAALDDLALMARSDLHVALLADIRNRLDEVEERLADQALLSTSMAIPVDIVTADTEMEEM